MKTSQRIGAAFGLVVMLASCKPHLTAEQKQIIVTDAKLDRTFVPRNVQDVVSGRVMTAFEIPTVGSVQTIKFTNKAPYPDRACLHPTGNAYEISEASDDSVTIYGNFNFCIKRSYDSRDSTGKTLMYGCDTRCGSITLEKIEGIK